MSTLRVWFRRTADGSNRTPAPHQVQEAVIPSL